MNARDRSHATAALVELLDDALAGESGIAVVGGSVAMGKTTLLATFTHRVRAAGGLVRSAVGSEAEAGVVLGVVAQLLSQATPSGPDGARADRLLAIARAHLAASPHGAPGRLSAVDAEIVESLCAVLLGPAGPRPLALVVDDIHHADPASLACLAYLARRMHTVPLLAVFGHADGANEQSTDFVEQLLRLPHVRSVRLAPLGPDQVRVAATAAGLGAHRAEQVAIRAQRLSGGNPLLLDGVLDDFRRGEHASSPGYSRAMLSCLHRSPEPTTAVAQALAVLADPEPIARLLGLEAGAVARCLSVLEASGVLERGRFRHPVAAAAVLADLGPEGTAALHRDAAELTYANGADATVVAEHLLAGRGVRSPWAVPVLDAAASSALAEGRSARAVDCLRLACALSEDGGELARATVALLRAERRVEPGIPDRRIPDLLRAVRAGGPTGAPRGGPDSGEILAVVRALAWAGRFEAAGEVVRHLAESGRASTPEAAPELRAARMWIRCSYPPLLELLPEVRDFDAAAPGLPGTTESRRHHDAAAVLDSVLTRGFDDRVVHIAERILHGVRLHGTDLDTVECALLALTYAERPASALPYCDELIAAARQRGEPGSRARLHAVRAEICLRLGDLPGAVLHATAAFDLVPIGAWGAAVGAPLSCLLNALTSMGRRDEAAELLYLPIPERMLHSRPGLHYLHARGRYGMAVEDWEGALADFRACGELMVRWGMDVPGLIAWRNDAGEAWLRMGERDRARTVLEEQASRSEHGGSPRTRGATLRLLAATHEPHRRLALLRQAVDALQESGDRYELARALADLTDMYNAVGETRRARVIGSQARIIADTCRAEPLSRLLPADRDRPDAESKAPAALLTDAEQRVADLVALGHTNSEIAKLLYITVSTVEQHLTRMYRKVGVNDRAQLASALFTGPHTRAIVV
ncbi:helix-turn-helix transcriptional regulator [Embleya hyalina]|uniref:LuxR family transcriptional regulator n=1 Tax=Embleya hyalina TaxID=516124 RepID=A0A401YM33_9ACTN|nr:LuxR family transcriptional regulator [Embleya hyalina]GCD95684.1 LuxR family transcriptional regulator [Embleya hyalina]